MQAQVAIRVSQTTGVPGTFMRRSEIGKTSLLSLYAVAGRDVKGFLDTIYVIYRDIVGDIRVVRNLAPHRLMTEQIWLNHIFDDPLAVYNCQDMYSPIAWISSIA